MRRKAFLLCSVLLSSCLLDLNAQGVLKESFNTDEFPKVSFVWHEYNPDVLNTSEFQGLSENGKSREFTVKNIHQEIDATEDRYVVLLWEDLAYHGQNLYDFSKTTLKNFIENVDLGAEDKINISVYGRRNINEESYLRDLTGGFVNDRSALLSAINGYRRNLQKYQDFPNRTDIFPAVSEAIEMLRKQGDGVKSVIVLTAGYPLDNSTGFKFWSYNGWSMKGAIECAMAVYKNKYTLNAMRKSAMEADFSWNESAKKYLELYKGLMIK